MKSFITLCFLLILRVSNAQTGVETNLPQETLHVNGTVRIDALNSNNLNADRLLGVDINNTLQEVIVGDNLRLRTGELNANGATIYNIAFIDDNYADNTFNDLDLDLTGANENITVFVLNEIGLNQGQFRITGIKGGTNGRIIVLKLLQENTNLVLVDENDDGGTDSAPENRLRIRNSLNVSNFGSFTLSYSEEFQRWVFINQQND